MPSFTHAVEPAAFVFFVALFGTSISHTRGLLTVRHQFNMRWVTLVAICSAVTFCLLVTPLLVHILDLSDQYDTSAYITSSIWNYGQETYKGPEGAVAGDKIIVMASLESQDTSWVAEKLPDWQRAIYIVDPSESSSYELTTPVNKGREAMAYLTYVIDNYDSLPNIIAFLHSHRKGFLEAWHTDTPLHDNVVAMQSLQLDFVAQNGYVNLRCNTNPGCTKGFKRKNPHVDGEVFQEIFGGTSTMPINATTVADEPTSSRQDREKARYIHTGVAAACCAQFAVSRDQVLSRPLDDYVKIRQWVMETERDDAHSGRVMEYLWHIIFGKSAIYCPDMEICYCSVYGRC